MGVRLTALNVWTNHRIPFECNDEWALKRVEDFNRAVGKTIFLPRRFGRANYVRIAPGAAQSNIGMLGGEQTLYYTNNSKYSIYHEMGHCVGLGHEYFHPGWPYRATLLGICPCNTHLQMLACNHMPFNAPHRLHKLAFLQAVGRYNHVGVYDARSIMNYNPNNFGLAALTGAPIPYITPDKLSDGDVALIRSLYPNALPF
jgi:hypothetical protein